MVWFYLKTNESFIIGNLILTKIYLKIPNTLHNCNKLINYKLSKHF